MMTRTENMQIFGEEMTKDGEVYPLLLQKDSSSRTSLEQNDLPIQQNNLCYTSTQSSDVSGSQLLISGATYLIHDPAVKENDDEIQQKETIQTPISAIKSESDQPEKLEISEEDRGVGTISFKLYWEYFRAGMHPIAIPALIVFFIASQGIKTCTTECFQWYPPLDGGLAYERIFSLRF
ncbi:hypothetical protein OS493_031548 [Desmophyllum pertusum]|uniref:Uncharacterized protein n=1 Tax=Desmophyllum pertusum TaxID=174260 RepID=A0A9X0CNS5_9CNID|nr:hypothetical protein OS493_031548 [Desmophyllum pertusum]